MTPMRFASLLLLALGTACAGPAAPAAAAHANAASAAEITIGDVPWQVGDRMSYIGTSRASFSKSGPDGGRWTLWGSRYCTDEVLEVDVVGPRKVRMWCDYETTLSSHGDDAPTPESNIPSGQVFIVWRDAAGLHGTTRAGDAIAPDMWKSLQREQSGLGRRETARLAAGRRWRIGEIHQATGDELASINAGHDADEARTTTATLTCESATATHAIFAIDRTSVGVTAAVTIRIATKAKVVIELATGRVTGTAVTEEAIGAAGDRQISGTGTEISEVLW